MKHWYRTTAAKVCCFLICILSLAVVVATVIGAVWLVEYEFYTRPERYIWEENGYYRLRSDAQRALTHSLILEESGGTPSYYGGFAFETDLTNVRFRISDPTGKQTHTNVTNVSDTDWSYEFRFAVWREYTAEGVDDGLRTQYLYEEDVTDKDVYTVQVYLESGLPVKDDYALMSTWIHIGYALRYWIYPIGFAALILFISCLAPLITVAGKRPNADETVPGPLHRVPFDLLLALTAVAFLFLVYLTDAWYTGELIFAICIIAVIVLGVVAVLGLLMSASTRIKCGTLLKNTVIWTALRLLFRVFRWLLRALLTAFRKLLGIIRAIPILWRTALLVLVLGIFDVLLVALAWENAGLAMLLAIVEFFAVSTLALYSAWVMRRLKKCGEALARGDLSHRTDTAGMLWDFKNHGDNLNRIGDGMAQAVEERLKSERMKAELVTNVSHDIKTPLTSIINYADLIVNEPCASPTHREYAEVLKRKSQHLKRLLEDLVEISKANTGNLEVELSPCDAGVLLTQTAGEFEQKCREAGLELITSHPEQSVRILADSRRIWRVFENLMNNACKYSLPGSRVYLTLQAENGEACFFFRNTSRAALNLSPEELTERFVRGDASRTTEGNGLGLSIARSLTELQNGRMEIAIDGDLFKVTLRFPLL